MIIKLILKQDGGLTLRSHRETCGIQHLRPRQLSGNSTTVGATVGILGDPHPGLICCVFFVQRCFFDCRKVNSLAIDGGCRQRRLPHATFSHVQSLHSTHDMCAWLKFELRPQNIHSSTRHVSPCASQHTEDHHKFSLTYISCVTVVLSPKPDLLSTHPVTHCKDPRQDGTSAEYQPLTAHPGCCRRCATMCRRSCC